MAALDRAEGLDVVQGDLLDVLDPRLLAERNEQSDVLAVALHSVRAPRPREFHPEQKAVDVVGESPRHDRAGAGDTRRRGQEQGFHPLRGLAFHDRHPGHSTISQRSSAGR
jgi:hypothetical protein